MPQVLDLEQALLLLELEPPFEKRDVQAARRRMAKVWHPDIAPPGKQSEHERHLKAVNEAADQLERLAEGSRGGKVSRNAVKVSAQAARAARAEAGRRNYEAQERARAQAADRQTHDPFGDRMPDHSVVHRYARCNSYPEWGVGTVSGIYFTGDGDDVQQWARVKFAPGVRTVPAVSLQFVDFSKPDPAHDRVQRFMTAAQHAMAEGKPELAAQRLIYARDAEPDNVAVLRLMTTAFWQAGDYSAAARAVHRGPDDADAWERVGRLRLRLGDRDRAIDALETARRLVPSLDGLLDLALAYQLAGDLGGEVSACEHAVRLEPDSEAAWSRLAHALARTDRLSEAIDACEHALALAPDDEVDDLLVRLRDALPRVLPAA